MSKQRTATGAGDPPEGIEPAELREMRVADPELLELAAMAALVPLSEDQARYRVRLRRRAEAKLRELLGNPSDRTLDD